MGMNLYSWSESIKHWNYLRKQTGRPHLIPHLRDHKHQIGGVLHLSEDSHGIIYSTQLSDKALAKETWALAHDGFIGTSYGYEPITVDYKQQGNRKVRRLLKVMVHEITSTTFPANPYALSAGKSNAPAYSTL